jgi:hypothetical protein
MLGTKYSLKKGRVYIHQKCGEATGITDEHFSLGCATRLSHAWDPPVRLAEGRMG